MPVPDSDLPLRTRRTLMQSGLCLLAGWPAAASASGPVVLTLAGRLSKAQGQRELDYDMEALASLPQRTLVTSTPWDSQVRRYTGPLLRDLLKAAGCEGNMAKATALNDYRVEIPLSDAQQFDLIIARLLDGQPMRVRERGPLALIYPYDSHAELRSERYRNRSAWQLRRLDIS